jgi:hypothetical protein
LKITNMIIIATIISIRLIASRDASQNSCKSACIYAQGAVKVSEMRIKKSPRGIQDPGTL